MNQASTSRGTMNPITNNRVSIAMRRLPLKYADWLGTHHVPFLVCSIGMIVMLLWAGSYKMTIPGADGIVELVSNNPLIAWQFRLFGTYRGANLIGATEWTAALLLLAGFRWPRAGVLGGGVASMMFLTTSSMLLTTPGAITMVHGKPYMSFMGLFLFKDVLSLGVALYLTLHFGDKARTAYGRI